MSWFKNEYKSICEQQSEQIKVLLEQMNEWKKLAEESSEKFHQVVKDLQDATIEIIKLRKENSTLRSRNVDV